MSKSKKWELTLKEVERMVGDSNASLFDRVTKLKSVAEDPLFREHHANVADAIDDHLDGFLGDYGISFADAALMLHYYPTRAQWQARKLRDMLAESIDRRREERSSGAPVVRSRSTVTLKDYQAIKQQAEEETARTKSLVNELRERRSELDRLREENAELRRDLARAEGRIQELERLLDREAAMV